MSPSDSMRRGVRWSDGVSPLLAARIAFPHEQDDARDCPHIQHTPVSVAHTAFNRSIKNDNEREIWRAMRTAYEEERENCAAQVGRFRVGEVGEEGAEGAARHGRMRRRTEAAPAATVRAAPGTARMDSPSAEHPKHSQGLCYPYDVRTENAVGFL